MNKLTKMTLIGLSAITFTACGGGSSSSENTMLSITSENAWKVYTSYRQSFDESIDFIEYVGRSMKYVSSPCVPMFNGTRILDNCEDTQLRLIIDGTVTITGDVKTDQFNISYSNFTLTSIDDGSMIVLKDASIDIDSNKGIWMGSWEGDVIKNGYNISLDAYNFILDDRGYTYSALTKSSELGQWVEEKTTYALNNFQDKNCPTKGEVLFTGNSSELKATLNSNKTTTLYLNGEYYDDVLSCEY